MGHRTLSTAGNIPKPIQTGYEMLAMLGGERLVVDGPRVGQRISTLATRSSDHELQLLVYNYDETDDDLTISDQVSIQITGMPDGDYTVQEYSMDRQNNNTYREWQKQGSPETPKDADLERMTKAAALSITGSSTKRCVNGEVMLDLTLPRHSMVLIKLSR